MSSRSIPLPVSTVRVRRTWHRVAVEAILRARFANRLIQKNRVLFGLLFPHSAGRRVPVTSPEARDFDRESSAVGLGRHFDKSQVVSMSGFVASRIAWRASTMNDITRILAAIEEGGAADAGRAPASGLRRAAQLAAWKLAQEKPGQTLQPTALVHEAYLRLVELEQVNRWDSRGHFFAAAADAMRRILVDRARHERRERHGGRWQRCELLDGDLTTEPASDDLLDLDDALVKFSAIDERAAELVKLRVFAGMTIDEVARYQGISPRTAKRSWAYARAWLMREIASASDASPN